MTERDPEILLVDIAKQLDRLGIEYFVSGGLGVVMWGRPRVTLDIDLVASIETAQLDILERALRDVLPQAYLDREAMEEAVRRQGEFNLIDSQTGTKIDFWLLQQTPFDQSRLKRRTVQELHGYPVTFSSPEDLIVIKLQWFRDSESTRHLEDAQSIVDISGKQIDRAYLGEWVERLGLEAEFAKLRF